MERGRRNRDHQNKLKSYYVNFQANERVEREREREREQRAHLLIGLTYLWLSVECGVVPMEP